MKMFKFAAVATMLIGTHGAVAQDDTVDLALVKDTPPSVGFEDRTPDILGIHFGDTAADAIATLKAAYPNAKVEERRDLPGLQDDRGNKILFNYLYEVVVTTDASPSEAVEVRFTTSATGSRVFQVQRHVSYPSDAFGSMETLRSSIIAKYGTPTLIEHDSRNNRVTISYTWEKRTVEPFPEQDVAKRQYGDPIPDNVDPCLGASHPYWSAGKFFDTYAFAAPNQRSDDPEMEACTGVISFLISYGSNDKTVSQITVIGTDWDRGLQDAQLVDELLPKLLNEKVNSGTGDGAPAL